MEREERFLPSLMERDGECDCVTIVWTLCGWNLLLSLFMWLNVNGCYYNSVLPSLL